MMLSEGRNAIVTGGSSGIGKATAVRLAAEGVRVTVNHYSDKEVDGGVVVNMSSVHEFIPWPGFGQPEQIAAAVVWAASDQASYVTGTTIVVDGGMSLYPRFV